MTGGELAIVIEGRRGDWPRGARTLTPREPTREPNGTPLVRGRPRPRRQPGVVPDRRRRPSAGCGRRHPHARGERLVDALLAWLTPNRQAHDPSLNRFQVRISAGRRPVDRAPTVVMTGLPRPDRFRRGRARAPDAHRAPPRRRPRISPNTRRAYSGALRRLRRLARRPAARGRHPRRVPRRAPRPGPGAGERRRRRWPRRASGPASPGRRARPGNGTARVLAGYRRSAGDRGRGQTRPFGAADLAAVLATCHQPRRRGRGRESEEVARERGRLDAVIAGLLFMGGMRRSEVSALRWADVDDAARRRRRARHRPPRQDEPGGRDEGRAVREGRRRPRDPDPAGRREPGAGGPRRAALSEGQVLVRLRLFRFFAEPVCELTRRAATTARRHRRGRRPVEVQPGSVRHGHVVADPSAR